MQAQLNKKATTTRLTNEGRFDEFKEVRENFRRKGYVGDACWIHALEEKDRKGRPFGQSLNIPAGVTLPPSGSANHASPSQAAGDESPMPEPPEAEAFRNKGKAQYADAVNWVATNLHLKNVNEAEAPNGIAVNLRRDAIALPRVREIFWAQIFPKLLPTEKEFLHIRKINAKNEDLSDATDTYERAMQEMADDEAAPASDAPTVAPEAQPSRESDDAY